MCGIFAYLNHKTPKSRAQICQTLVSGLRRLEYRGYDSAGIAVDDDRQGIVLIKRSGNVNQLQAGITELTTNGTLSPDQELETHVGIAHTRWATHGPPSDINAHPQPSDPNNEFVIVHNGIITNYDVLKKFLQKNGHVFESETDTEVVAKLTKYIWDRHNQPVSFPHLIMEVLHMLNGAYALLFKSKHFPNDIVACKRGSPLILGIRKKDETANLIQVGYSGDESESMELFLASDASAIVEHTRKVVYLEDDDVVHCSGGKLSYFSGDRETRQLVVQDKRIQTLDMELESIMKGSFPHFMLKEIFEQPDSLANTMRGRVSFEDGSIILGGLKNHISVIRRSRRLIMFACGTSYHSALAVRIAIEELTNIPVVMELASDFQDRSPPIFRDDVCCFISQSGETKDTLNALEYCVANGAFCVGFTNTVGSSIARKTHCGVHINAGAEIGVASTKAYTSQIVALLMFGLMLCSNRACAVPRRQAIVRAMLSLSDKIRKVLECDAQVKAIAQELKDSRSMLLMGRGYQYATCMEGALKIKELSYIHSEGIHTGELNYGPLALVSPDVPVVVVCTTDPMEINEGQSSATTTSVGFTQVVNCVEQVLKRQGKPIVVTDVPNTALTALAHHNVYVPQTINCLQPIINIIPLQLLSYHLAVFRGQNVDCPRNLAKSVTV